MKHTITEVSQTQDSDPATPAQCIAICRLCFALGIKEPLEERIASKGEAGRLIRELAVRARANRKKYGQRINT
jgi:hypothetical protein